MGLISILPGVISASDKSPEKFNTLKELLPELERKYGKVETFTARVKITSSKPVTELTVKLISGDERLVRIEYLKPTDLKGTIYILEGTTLYHYIPISEYVVQSNIKEKDLPGNTLNLAPSYLTNLLRSEDLEANLLHGPDNTDSAESQSSEAEGETSDSSTVGNTQTEASKAKLPVNSDICSDSYLLEVLPRVEKYGFERQLICLEAETLLPQKIRTVVRPEGSKEEQIIVTVIEELQVNVELDPNSLRQLPEGAETIS